MRTVSFAAALVTVALAGCGPAGDGSPTPVDTASPTPSERATPSPTPSATPSPTPSASPTPAAAGTYLALGDSLAVGVGATDPGTLGYVARLFTALSRSEEGPRATVVRSLAVSGETSTSMIRTGQLAGALEAIAGADPPVTLVTLDIGGNDLLRLLGTDACASAPEGADCQQLVALTLDDFEANYRQILEELTAALDEHAPDAPLAVMTYFNPFSGTDAAHEAAGQVALLGTDGRLDCEADESRSRGMNDIIACVAEELGAIPIDVQPAFDTLGLELTHIGARDIHANDRGYEVIAEAFREALGR